MAAYVGLFITCLLAGTVLPFRSEVFLFSMFLREQFTPWLLIVVASGGSIVGAVANWFLGRAVAHFGNSTWFPVQPDRMARAGDLYIRYGRWSLLLSWLPFIGDPLTILAGVMRERLGTFLFLVGTAKVARYVALAGVSLGWL
jgi:membrane protein YqaA with SNARE-associated domain